MRTIIKADNSQMSCFLTCPQKWAYEYIHSIEPIGYKKPALEKGTVVHAMLDYYYKAIGMKKSPMDAYKESIEVFKARDEVKTYLSKDELFFISQRFFQYVTAHLHQDFRPMVLEGKPQVEMGFSLPLFENNSYLFVVEGRIDLITQDEFFVDHKSQERKYDHYKFDTQFLTYAWATGLRKGMVNYFGLQKEINQDTFRRLLISISSQHIARWKDRMLDIFFQMAQCLKSKKYEQRENSCPGSWGYFCHYTPLCETLHPPLRDKLIQLQYKPKARWEPWSLQEVKNAETSPSM
jgi:hypothetical protein